MPFLPCCSCGALTSLLLCHSCVAAAVPLSPLPRCCRTAPAWLLLNVVLLHHSCMLWRSQLLLLWCSSYSPHRCCCGALASLLPCRSRLAAVVALLHPSCCGALASLLLWRSSQLISLLLLLPPLWRSRITAAVLLSLGCCMRCMALSHRYCRAPFASLRLRRSPLDPLLLLYMALSYRCCLVTLAWLAGAVARSHRCCCGALASLLPCRSCIADTLVRIQWVKGTTWNLRSEV